MRVLVTGGAGYIGSHTVLDLLKSGHSVISVDNYCNSTPLSLTRVCLLAFGSETHERLVVEEGDLTDVETLERIFLEHRPEAVIHFAALKAVGESCEKPLEYYINNVTGTLHLLDVMRKHEVYTMIYSSSATVYGSPTMDQIPLKESLPVAEPPSPYGSSKVMIERILQDMAKASDFWRFIILRYFNPIGADESGTIGEDQGNKIANLMPYVTAVALGNRKELSIFGDDYPTEDGTCLRDYIHVSDLSRGHVCALEKSQRETGCFVYNLGVGIGYSVLDIVKTFKEATGIEIPYQIVGRRSGDVPALVADNTLAKSELNWEPQYDLLKMCADHWRWQEMNPNGYH